MIDDMLAELVERAVERGVRRALDARAVEAPAPAAEHANTAAAAELRRVTPATIRAWHRRGKLRAVATRPLLFARADVLAAPTAADNKAPEAGEWLRARAARGSR